jgi:hypothetical protein
MDNYIIDYNLIDVGYYGESIAHKINLVVNEIVHELKKQSGLDNVFILLNDCYIESDGTQRKKRIVLGYSEEIIG